MTETTYSSRAYRGDTVLRGDPSASRGPIYDKYYSSNKSAITDEIAPKKRNGWLIFAIIVAALIIIGIIALVIYLLTRGSGNGGGGGGGGGNTPVTQPVGGACTSSSNCNAGLICDANICKQPPRGPCSGDDQCPAGFLCSGGACLGAGGSTCVANEDCLGSFNCINNVCTQTVCTADADCRGGYTCDTTTSICQGGIGDSCLNNSQCTDTTPLQPFTTEGGFSFCSSVNHVCGGIVGSLCADNSECAYPFICTGGVCSYRTCNNDLDCPSNGITNTFPECLNGYCIIQPGGNAFQPNCTNDTQCDQRTFEQGAERRCSGFGLCGLYGGVDCTGYPGVGSICATTPVFTCPPGPGQCTCGDSSQCIVTKPNCSMAGLCQASPEPVFERTNIINMKRKNNKEEKRTKIGGNYMKDGDNIDEDDIKAETIRSTGREAYYKQVVTNMINR